MTMTLKARYLRLGFPIVTAATACSLVLGCASTSPNGFDPRDANRISVVTQRRIITRTASICIVLHTATDEWFFLSNTTSDELDPSITTTLDAVLKLDPTILRLAELPKGWRADRNTAADAWVTSELRQAR